MEIKTFDPSYLREAKDVLKEAFYRDGSDAAFNEWEFAEQVLKSEGYLPELCLIALDKGGVIGYHILTAAAIGGSEGLALGPLGVKAAYRNRGVGARLVEESIERAKSSGYRWIALLGGDYYTRFGFEKAQAFGIVVSDNAFENAHLQILFLDNGARKTTSGKLAYCSAFYDEQGKLM